MIDCSLLVRKKYSQQSIIAAFIMLSTPIPVSSILLKFLNEPKSFISETSFKYHTSSNGVRILQHYNPYSFLPSFMLLSSYSYCYICYKLQIYCYYFCIRYEILKYFRIIKISIIIIFTLAISKDLYFFVYLSVSV